MRLNVTVIAAIGGLCLSGCTLVGSEAWYVKSERSTLLKRASFDLDCDAAQLKDERIGENYKSVGVRGCGKSGSYIFARTAEFEWTWVLNHASGTNAPVSDPKPPAP